MQLRCEGVTVNGLREGLWVYYFPSGNRQTEATFVGGKEEGPYRVYRDNGVPYYIGQYRGGQRYGIWEVYDPEGNLTGTKEFFKEE
jgi:antitoxin component YwqK of YwqJK toxin-antitoxin module